MEVVLGQEALHMANYNLIINNGPICDAHLQLIFPGLQNRIEYNTIQYNKPLLSLKNMQQDVASAPFLSANASNKYTKTDKISVSQIHASSSSERALSACT